MKIADMPQNFPKGKANETTSLKSDETTPRKPLDAWDKEARRVLKVEMLRAGHTPESLAALLKDSGYGTNTPKALAQRIVRGSFNFGFALRVLNALGVRTLDIGYIDTKKHKKPR